MAGRGKLRLALAAVVALALTANACGGGSADSTTDSTAPQRVESTPGQGGGPGKRVEEGSGKQGGGDAGRQQDGSSQGGSGEAGADSGDGETETAAGSSGSEEFVVPGGDNSVPNFGEEASASERAQASEQLQTYMRARAAENQKAACATLSRAAIAQLEDLASVIPDLEGTGCVAILRALDQRTPRSARANTMTGPIASLRVEGEQGFALYHGTGGTDYTIQMAREGGSWKVAALEPFALS